MVNQKTITLKLNKYIAKVGKKIPIDKAYLIGSWAEGKARVGSDVDLLVLSDYFANLDMDERLRVLYKNTVGIDFDIHIHAVTQDEFKKASLLTTLGAMRIAKKVALKE